MEQKQVNLIGLRVLNNGIIQAAELTPDVLQKRLVLITGETGNGKSTLLNAAKIATAGTDAIKKSDALPDGFVTEAKLVDGEVPIYIGVKTGIYQRGEKEGKKKLETYLYTKDINGKIVNSPIIDGEAWTAAKYWKALTTELTHSFADLFSENQTVQRNLIEKLFRPELEKLKIDEVMSRIEEAKKVRDNARTMCQANGAFMERFIDEGWTEAKLDELSPVNIEELENKITRAMVDKAKALDTPEAEYKLACVELDHLKANKVQALKDQLLELDELISADAKRKSEKYINERSEYERARSERDSLIEQFNKLRNELAEFIGYNVNEERRNEQGVVFLYSGDEAQQALIKGIDNFFGKRYEKFKDITEPVHEPEDEELAKKRKELQATIDATIAEPVNYPERRTIDTSDIDCVIEQLKSQKESAQSINTLYKRYMLWREWIEAKGKYEKEIDTLRKIYAQINTGVEGMKIVPRETESGRIEVWVMYNGQYDREYFNNPNGEFRFLFDYSSFQRTIIGLMLQAARLNLKPRALRIAFIDDVAFTTRDINVLSDIAEKLDLKLITAWTHEADKDGLMDGQILVDGGEVFFK